MPKNVHTTTQLHLSHTLIKWCSICSKPGFNSTGTVTFQMFKLDLEKAEEPEIKLLTSTGSSKKQESSRKMCISASLTMPKPLTVWISINCGKLLERWEHQTILPVFWETSIQVKKQQLEACMEQLIGSRLRKKYDRAVCCQPVCVTDTLSWANHEKRWAEQVTSWNQDRLEKHQQPQIPL